MSRLYNKFNNWVKVKNSKNGNLTAKAVVIEDNFIERVSAGRIFTASANIETVTAGETVYMLVATGSKCLHLTFDINAVGQWFLETFLDPTVSDLGAENAPFNRRECSTLDFESTLYQGSTITADGTARLATRFGAGERANNITTAENRSDIDSIFDPNSLFLMKLTNESSVSSYLSVTGNFYEEEIIK